VARDAIVEEVRRIRDAMAKAHGYDVKKFVRAVQREEVKRGRELVTLPPRRLATKRAG
jgi:hypothetical protein